MSPIEEKILKMESDLQKYLDKAWKDPSGSLRHDYQQRSGHEHYARAKLWEKLINEIKSFEFVSLIKQSDKEGDKT